ncbi:MAG: DUF1194 domain-containing protein [Pseudomonadota bacterium]
MKLKIIICLLLVFATSLHARGQTRQVALELVLAVDTSTSVDEAEFELQRTGLADAFAHPELVAVIEAIGNLGIAVTLIEWAGTDQQEIVVGWSHLTDRSSSLAFSDKIRSASRPLKGMTDIGSVLSFSINQLENNTYRGNRLVIDVSGDGSSSVENSAIERDRAIARGITINGLVIFNEEYDLGELAEVDLVQYYSNQVIGGNGAFLITAKGFEDFRIAILNKLLREIRGSATVFRRMPIKPDLQFAKSAP